MKRIASWTAAAVLGASLLTGCGGGTDEYCSTLEDTKDEFSALDSSDADAFERFSDVVDDLVDESPDEVEDDWKVMQKAFDDLEDTLEDAGLSMEDFGDLQSGEVPEDIDQEKLQALGEELQGFGEGLDEAGDNISEHAKEECDIDLAS